MKQENAPWGLGLAALRHTATYLRVFGLKREFPTENPSV